MDCETVLVWEQDKAVTIIFDKKTQVWNALYRLIGLLFSKSNTLNDKMFIRLRTDSIELK